VTWSEAAIISSIVLTLFGGALWGFYLIFWRQ